MAQEASYAEGMRLLRSAATLQIIFYILTSLGSLIIFLSMLPLLTFFTRPYGAPLRLRDIVEGMAPSLTPIALAVALIVTGAVISLVAVYARLIPSASRLAEWRSKLRAPSKLIKYGYWGALVFGILALILLGVGGATAVRQALRGGASGGGFMEVLSLIFSGASLAITGMILWFIGWVGLLILLLELSSETGISGFKVAAVLHIVGAAVSLLSVNIALLVIAPALSLALEIAAWYFTRESANRALRAPPPPPTP